MMGNSENIRVRRNSKLVSKNREEYDPCIHGPGVDNCGHPDCTGTPKKKKPYTKKPIKDRFFAKVSKDDSGCWLWTASKDPNGYGQFNANGTMVKAHSFSYKLVNGDFEKGLCLDHLCRVRHCVNPDHLEVVTPQENSRRGYFGQKTHCKNGHPYNEVNTYTSKSNKRDCRRCHCEREARYRQAKKQDQD